MSSSQGRPKDERKERREILSALLEIINNELSVECGGVEIRISDRWVLRTRQAAAAAAAVFGRSKRIFVQVSPSALLRSAGVSRLCEPAPP